MKKYQQITVKIGKNQHRALKKLAKAKGEQPLSYLIREAIQEYIDKHKE